VVISTARPMASANYARRLIRRVTEGPQSRQRGMSASLIGHHCQAPCFLAFVVITAWVTLLYVVGLAECRAATSIGRTEVENLTWGRAWCGALIFVPSSGRDEHAI